MSICLFQFFRPHFSITMPRSSVKRKYFTHCSTSKRANYLAHPKIRVSCSVTYLYRFVLINILGESIRPIEANLRHFKSRGSSPRHVSHLIVSRVSMGLIVSCLCLEYVVVHSGLHATSHRNGLYAIKVPIRRRYEPICVSLSSNY